LYIQSLSRSKKDTSFASAWRASRGVVPAFCTNSAQVFSPFYPPPYTFFNSNNLQSFAILFVYFSPGRKCKNTLPLPVKAKKGCFYARQQARQRLQKAILLPTGCVCFEQEKRGPVYPHLVQLSLESFSAPLYNILVIRNKGVPDESSPTHLGRLFCYTI